MYTFESRVRYSEVNSERKLTLPALLDYLQDCCTFQSEELGVGLDYIAEHHAAWILLSWEIEILRYPVMGERIRIGTWPYEFKGFYGSRNFLIEDVDGNTLARANSIWVFMDTERMRPARVPENLLTIYGERFDNLYRVNGSHARSQRRRAESPWKQYRCLSPISTRIIT